MRVRLKSGRIPWRFVRALAMVSFSLSFAVTLSFSTTLDPGYLLLAMLSGIASALLVAASCLLLCWFTVLQIFATCILTSVTFLATRAYLPFYLSAIIGVGFASLFLLLTSLDFSKNVSNRSDSVRN